MCLTTGVGPPCSLAVSSPTPSAEAQAWLLGSMPSLPASSLDVTYLGSFICKMGLTVIPTSEGQVLRWPQIICSSKGFSRSRDTWEALNQFQFSLLLFFPAFWEEALAALWKLRILSLNSVSGKPKCHLQLAFY